MSAEDAVRAHIDVRARRLFPLHWGTFNLAFHDWTNRSGTHWRQRAPARSSCSPRGSGRMVDADQAVLQSLVEAVR